MRRFRCRSWLQLIAALSLLAAGSSQAQRLTEIQSGPAGFDQRFGCLHPYCTNAVTAMHGNTVILTAEGTGVLVRNAAGAWELQQELWNPDSPSSIYPVYMGEPAAVYGDVLLLSGTSRIYNFHPVIYVWQRSGTTWTHTQVLGLPRAAGFDRSVIGSVQFDRGTAAVCTIQRDNAETRAQAQIDVFTLRSGRFQRQARFVAPLTVHPQALRCPLALDGSTLVVGDAYAEQEAGRVLVYGRGSAGWTLQRRLTASDSSPGTRFGASVDVAGNSIVVGAPQRPNFDQALHPGAVYVFQRTATSWAQMQLLVKPEATPGEPPAETTTSYFGGQVALTAERLVASWVPEEFTTPQTPHAYLYERRGVWAPVAQLSTYPDIASYDLLMSDSLVIQTTNVRASYPYDLPPLWTLPPRVDEP
jgi:hypothetical protein